MGPSRLDELLRDVHPEAPAEASISSMSVVPGVSSEALFTARVLDTLPEPLQWTGLTPRMRAATLLAFHVAAGVVAYLVFQWASPQLLESATDPFQQWVLRWSPLSAEAGEGVWLGGLGGLAVAVVALVAFWATRSHTRAT